MASLLHANSGRGLTPSLVFFFVFSNLVLLGYLPVAIGSVWFSAILALGILLLPGYLFSSALLPLAHAGSERLLLSLAGGLTGAIFYIYLFQLLPGVPSALFFLLGLDLLSLIGFFLPQKKQAVEKLSAASLGLLAILLLASVLRLTHLGSAEFQGDEARAMELAANVFEGQKSILLSHKKGPVEALLPAASMILTGKVNEFSARLPFALSGIAIIPAVYFLVLAFCGRAFVAFTAACIVTFDGFLLAFSRIVQYQAPLVFLLTCSFILLWRAREDGLKDIRGLLFFAFFFSASLLCHYDAALVVPAILIIFWDAWTKAPKKEVLLRAIFYTALLSTALLSLFYLPFFLSPKFSETTQYLLTRVGPNKFPYNNLVNYLLLLSFYSSAYSVAFIATILLIAAAWISARRMDYSLKGKLIACVIFLLCLVLILYHAAFETGNGPVLVLTLFCAAILTFFFCAKLSLLEKMLLLWCAVPLLFFGFFTYRPNTHFYIQQVAVAIICALTLEKISSSLNINSFRLAARYSFLIVALIAVPYLYYFYLQQEPELRFTYPKGRPTWYWAPYGGKLPKGGFFGFPHRSGWKVISELYRNGTLSGSYSSNEEELITCWYLRGIPRDDLSPQNYFIVKVPNDPVPVSRRRVEAEYSFTGRVYVDSRPRIDIRSSVRETIPPKEYHLADFIDTFDLSQMRRP